MTRHQLTFNTTPFKKIDGTEYKPMLTDEVRINLIIKELLVIYKREAARPMECCQLPFTADEDLLEAIGYLEKATEWPEPEDAYSGEPPITMAEMHTAAWKEHQEAHR